MSRKHLLILGKAIVSIGLLAWVFSQVDLSASWRALSTTKLGYVAGAIALHLVAYAILNLRWWLLLRHLHPNTPFVATIPSFILGMFGNNFLPTGVGGDVLKIWHMRRFGIPGTSLVASSVVDRVLGLLGVLLIGLGALVYLGWGVLPGPSRYIIVALLTMIPLFLVALFSAPFERFIARLKAREKHPKWIDTVYETLTLMSRFRHGMGSVLLSLPLTVILQSLIIVAFVLVARSVGSDVSWLAMFVVIPIVFLVMSLPISLGGLGVREGALVALLATFGVSQQSAASISLINLLIVLGTTLPGGLVLLFDHRGRAFSGIREALDTQAAASLGDVKEIRKHAPP